jgi:hypothetical protein
VAVFLVDDLEAEMAVLGNRGVIFEKYDLPRFKTAAGVHRDDETGSRARGSRTRTGTFSASRRS